MDYSVISKQIRVVSPKFYTVRKNFTGPPVPPVPTNLKSGLELFVVSVSTMSALFCKSHFFCILLLVVVVVAGHHLDPWGFCSFHTTCSCWLWTAGQVQSSSKKKSNDLGQVLFKAFVKVTQAWGLSFYYSAQSEVLKTDHKVTGLQSTMPISWPLWGKLRYTIHMPV